ncbi:MAG: NurA domain-containing protein, partial [Bacteroidota bacterium]
GKLIYHSTNGGVYVATIPVKDKDVMDKPRKADFKNLELILDNIDYLKCDMYDNALVPVTLANKLVSLSNSPSKILLEKFAVDAVPKK